MRRACLAVGLGKRAHARTSHFTVSRGDTWHVYRVGAGQADHAEFHRRLSEDFGATAGFAGLGYVAFTVGMTIGRLGGDLVVMRIGDERLLRRAIVVAGLGLATAALVPNRWVVLVAYGVAGLGDA